MKMRDRKRRAMRRAVPVFSGLLRYGIRARLKQVRGGFTYAEPIVFPAPADTWGTVTHSIGPFVPLPARRDIRFERRLARMRGRIGAALVITEE